MNLFQEIIRHFQSNTQYEKFIKESEKEYDIKIYKLSQYPLHYAQQIVKDLTMKYKLGKIISQPTGWNENERKLFVWFIVSFLHYKMIDIINLIDGCQRYWKVISSIFWDKEIPFLKYQVLNLIKFKGRTNWKAEQEELLSKAYNTYKKGDWNQIAKFIYFSSECKIFKTPKQCRQRWQNHLNAQVLKGNWTSEQDQIILSYVKQKGKKWAQIFRQMQNRRTQHMIKNRYQSLIKKQLNKKNSRSANEEQAVDNLLKDCQNFIEYCQSQILDDFNDDNQKNNKEQQESQLKNEVKIDQIQLKNKPNQNNIQVDGCYIEYRSSYSKRNNMIIFNNEDTIKLDSSSNSKKWLHNKQMGFISFPSVYSMSSLYLNQKSIKLQNCINNQDFGQKGSSFYKINYSGYEKSIFQSNKFD